MDYSLVKDKINSVLKKSARGLPIYQIAEQLRISAATASKFCHILQAEGKIKITKFGNMKIVEIK